MKAVLIKKPGGPEVLRLGTYRRPKHTAEEVLVRVEATALNRADLLQRAGKYPPPKGASPIPGLEVSGVVEQRGRKAKKWAKGARVFGLLAGGGYAEYVAVHEDLLMPIPENLSFEEAAAIPEAFLTAFQALYWLGDLKAGQHVLIHAGASGVGTAAIQLVRATRAHACITASPSKHQICRNLGAEVLINYHEEDFVERVLAATHSRGVDLVLDFIGAPYLERNLNALATDGRIILLASMGGSVLESFDLRRLFAKRARVTATTLRSRSLDYKIKLTQEFASFVLPMIAEGRVKAVIDSTYHWKNAADAHRRMEANRNVGKIVMQVVR